MASHEKGANAIQVMVINRSLRRLLVIETNVAVGKDIKRHSSYRTHLKLSCIDIQTGLVNCLFLGVVTAIRP